jgi:hypothetical protein
VIQEAFSEGCIYAGNDRGAVVSSPIFSTEVEEMLVPKPLRLYIDRMAAGSKRARSQKQNAPPRRSSQRKNAF